MSKSKAFTLTELIVVIIVIALLAAIFFPVFSYNGHGKSKQIACVTNLKQIGLAICQYMQDYDNRLPPRQTATPSRQRASWRSLTYPYVKSKPIFQCLSNPGRQWADSENDGFMRSYAVNSSSGGAGEAGGPFNDQHPALRADKMKHPESTIIIVESTAAFDDFNPLFPGAFAQPSRQDRIAGHLFCHKQVSNVLFADFHVKSMHPVDTLRWSNSVNTWTIDGSPYSPTDLAVAKSTLAYGLSQSNVDGSD